MENQFLKTSWQMLFGFWFFGLLLFYFFPFFSYIMVTLSCLIYCPTLQKNESGKAGFICSIPGLGIIQPCSCLDSSSFLTCLHILFDSRGGLCYAPQCCFMCFSVHTAGLVWIAQHKRVDSCCPCRGRMNRKNEEKYWKLCSGKATVWSKRTVISTFVWLAEDVE